MVVIQKLGVRIVPEFVLSQRMIPIQRVSVIVIVVIRDGVVRIVMVTPSVYRMRVKANPVVVPVDHGISSDVIQQRITVPLIRTHHHPVQQVSAQLSAWTTVSVVVQVRSV